MDSGRSIIALLSLLGLFGTTSAAKAWDFYDIVDSGSSVDVYGVDSSSGEKTLLTTKTISGGWSSARTHVDGKNRLVIASGSTRYIYDSEANSWTDSTYFSGTAYGASLVRKSGDTISIGENSLKLRERGGRQQMWATDANGDSIDIDVVNGSRLLINGRDVEKSIDNVGALSAALGSVPAISADSQFTCGFGGGTHSSAYAMSAGCASRVSDRVSVNAALATVINNHTGDSDDNLSARAGFTFRLGKVDDSPRVAARKAAELHDKVAKLEERNESLLALLQAQSSRLERLEKIASGQLFLMGDRALSD